MDEIAPQIKDSATPQPEEPLVISRKSLYLKALQSERIQVLVGAQQRTFQIPRDLLAKCSPVFNAMCNSSFKESVDGFIRLPEVNVTTFEDFMLWLHCYIPSQTIQKEFPAVLELAIFADMYQILPLQNQTSDIILQLLIDDQSPVTPEIISQVYESTPDSSVLRRHFCLGFCTIHDPASRRNYSSQDETSSDWRAVFDEFPNFGRDFFIYTQSSPKTELHNRDFCSFHDHSNMIGWDRQGKRTSCPYQEGNWFENAVITDKVREAERLRKKQVQAMVNKKMRKRILSNRLLAATEGPTEETDSFPPEPLEETPREDVPDY